MRGRGVQAQAGSGDDAQGALAAHEHLVEVGSGGLAGVALGVDHRAVGQDHVEPDDHVLDLAVAGGELAGPAARQPAADRGQGHRLGPVPAGEAVGGAQLVLEVVAERAGQHVGGERGVVDVADAGQVAQVEHDAAVERDRRPADPAAARGRRHRDGRLVADGQHRGHLVDLGRPHHRGGQAADLAFQRPGHGQRPPVAAGLGPLGRVDGDRGTGGRQALDHGVGHRHRRLGEAGAGRRRDRRTARWAAVGAPGPRSGRSCGTDVMAQTLRRRAQGPAGTSAAVRANPGAVRSSSMAAR